MSLITLTDVRRTYDMGGETVRALDGVTLDIGRGETVAIIGQSGSGKSTMMNILGCLDTPTSGSYSLLGHDTKSLDDDELAAVRNRTIGFIFQSFQLLPRQSALENVALPLMYRREGRLPLKQRLARAQQMLDEVGLGDRAHHRPNEMSGGQRQRVAIARALATAPDVILADEPTGNLDTKTSQEVLDLLFQLQNRALQNKNAEEQQERTVIIVTHEPDVAAQCARTIRLVDGKVVTDTRPNPATPAPATTPAHAPKEEEHHVL